MPPRATGSGEYASTRQGSVDPEEWRSTADWVGSICSPGPGLAKAPAPAPSLIDQFKSRAIDAWNRARGYLGRERTAQARAVHRDESHLRSWETLGARQLLPMWVLWAIDGDALAELVIARYDHASDADLMLLMRRIRRRFDVPIDVRDGMTG